jgi:membrane peptidoglycan carboxypeptidase
VPFKLPKADGYAETDDNAPQRLSDSVLRAQDQPLPAKPGSAEPTIDLPATDDTDELPADVIAAARRAAPRPVEDGDTDEDVPFKLPKADQPAPTLPPIPPVKPRKPQHQPDAQTLVGTGGLDPNPDAARPTAAPTMAVPRVPSPVGQTVPNAQYQRPPAPQPPTARPNYAPAPPTLQMAGVQAPPPANSSGRRGKPRKRLLRPGCMAVVFGLVLTFCGGLSLLSLLVGGVAYARVGDLVNERLANIEDYRSFQTTYLLDRNGRELYQLISEGRRTKVPFARFPQDLIDATIATEDDEFWTNIGIDIPATAVALLNYVRGNGSAAGGSSITQQVVRNILFDFEYRLERSATRKAEEILLAIALTGRLSKEDILELYLNEIYYGNLAYGVEAASQTFFGKPVEQLTLPEAALLAGLPQAPRDLDPLNPDPDVQQAVYDRWRLVLDLMLEERYITQAEHAQALSTGYTLVNPEVPLNAPHFTFFARDQFEELMTGLGYSPEQVATGGYRVFTTVDVRINDMAQAVVRDQISKLGGNNVTNGAVVVLKPITGEILAMVGSADYNNAAIDGSFNVTVGLRQPGSSVKPFTFAAAIERGMNTADVIWDTRTEIGIPGQPPYIPRNYDSTFHGPMRMRYALANSYNIPAVQTLRHNVGVEYLIGFFRRLGMTSINPDPSLYGLSLTLGGGELSPLELTRGYAAFANEGVLVNTTAILCVLDFEGNIVYQYENNCPSGTVTNQTVNRTRETVRVLDPRIAFAISDMLSDNAARTPAMGGNSALRTPFTSSVKTGTTDNVKDNWTVGYTRNIAVGVWVGNSNGSPMVNTSGLTGAAPIWNQVITTIQNTPEYLNEFGFQGQLFPDGYTPPQGIAMQTICDVRALQEPATGCAGQTAEWILQGPAGVPDGSGGLVYPSAQLPAQDPNSSIQLVSPGVYKAWVVGLPPEVANSIQFSLAPGQRRPPAPLYCRVPPGTAGARELFFIAPPPEPNDAASAEEYARARNLAFLPSIECSGDLAGAALNSSPPAYSNLPINVVNAQINWPAPGENVGNAPRPILGTINFDSSQVQYYRFLIRGPHFPDWTVIGEPHYSPVIDGTLEVLYPPPTAGSYQLMLELYSPSGMLVQQPIFIPFNVP